MIAKNIIEYKFIKCKRWQDRMNYWVHVFYDKVVKHLWLGYTKTYPQIKWVPLRHPLVAWRTVSALSHSLSRPNSTSHKFSILSFTNSLSSKLKTKRLNFIFNYNPINFLHATKRNHISTTNKPSIRKTRQII